MKIEISTENLSDFYKSLRLHSQPGFVNFSNIGTTRQTYKADNERYQVPYTEITLKAEYIEAFKSWAKENNVEYEVI